jgi:glycogen phosphorylase
MPGESVVVRSPEKQPVAYFSMEICLEEAIPTYSGGLGVLAGDTLRSAADLGLPVIGVTLAHRKGYFTQRLDSRGNQSESPAVWYPEERLDASPARAVVQIAGRDVHIRAWRYDIVGVTGHIVPVYLLDTDLSTNSDADRALTDCLYGGDSNYRLQQEIVLGIGGCEILRAIGLGDSLAYHMNEGHSALLALALLERQLHGRAASSLSDADLAHVRRNCIFTTHTPVPAGHDRFPMDQVRPILGDARSDLIAALGLDPLELHMTRLALRCSRWTNGVALRHGEVSRDMFPDYDIAAVTNGVHAVTWTAAPIQTLLDRYAPSWKRDNSYLRYASTIPVRELREAHSVSKRALIAEVEKRSGVQLDPNTFTIGFARRAAPYKQADLLFHEVDWLRVIARRAGPLQVIYSGKAHPADSEGRKVIQRVFEGAASLGEDVRVVWLENYEMGLGKLLTSGVDLWLNTPMRPLEASGTSGMKAALNGIPSLSVLDGWWVEGHVEGITGWSIGDEGDTSVPDRERDARDMYSKLEHVILPMYYQRPAAWGAVMRNSIALNGTYFNTQRMVEQYARNAYAPSISFAEDGYTAAKATVARAG